MPRDELEFTAHEKSRLEQGLVVRRDESDVDYLYAYLPDSELVWSAAFDLPTNRDEEMTASGTAYLIQKELDQFPPEQQLAAMAELKGSHSSICN